MRALRIVIADDQRDNALTLAALLRGEGHDTRIVHDGAHVLAVVQQYDPDAVLLDISMPSMNGWDVARQLRAHCGFARPMIIGVSGVYTKGADRILGEMSGINAMLGKPYSIDSLLALLAPLSANP